MGEEFVEYLEYFVDGIMEAVKKALAWIIAIITFPSWGCVFIFWYFTVYKPQQEEQQGSYSEIPNNTWKQQTMSRFERVE